MVPPRRLRATLSAVADPTCRGILATLMAGEASVQKLAAPYAMTLPGFSKHLKVLERAGLIERSRSAQWRPCRLSARPLKEVSDWLERYRIFWEASFDRLDDYLRELQSQESTKSNSLIKKSRTTTIAAKRRKSGRRK